MHLIFHSFLAIHVGIHFCQTYKKAFISVWHLCRAYKNVRIRSKKTCELHFYNLSWGI